MNPEDKLKYSRPTTAVRVRPYIFLYLNNIINLNPLDVVSPLRFLPQGNLAEGNRVTWGWKIRLLVTGQTGATILWNGAQIIIPAGIFEFELIDTIKNAAGIDSSEYSLSLINGDPMQVHVIQQLLQIAPL